MENANHRKQSKKWDGKYKCVYRCEGRWEGEDHIEWLGRPSPLWAHGAEIAIGEGGVVSPGVEEREGEGVPFVTRRVVEKMVARLGTQSPNKREPLI